jgi:flagellar hook-basal body complex protein FliE
MPAIGGIGGVGVDPMALYRSMPQYQGMGAVGEAGDAAGAAGTTGAQGTGAESFKDLVTGKLQGAMEMQAEGNMAAQSLATGTATDISAATIAVQKAAISLQTVAAFRNKAIEAYQDIMRMQV